MTNLGAHNRLKEIDYLRAVAIIMTIYCHITALFPWGYAYPKYLSNTNSGVQLFFVISGYVVLRSIFYKFDTIQKKLEFFQHLSEFYLRRFFRIIIMSWLWLWIVIGLCYLFVKDTAFPPFKMQLIYEAIHIMTIRFNYSEYLEHSRLNWYWSLSFEEQFYLLLPIVLVFRPLKITVLSYFQILLLALYIADYVLEVHFDMPKIFLSFCCIILGCTIWLEEEFSKKKLHLKFNNLFWNSLSLILIFMLAAQYDIFPNTTVGVTRHSYIMILSGILVYLASRNEGRISAMPFIGAPLEYIGKRSYGLYLVHVPCLWLTQEAWKWAASTYGFEFNTSRNNEVIFTAVCLMLIISELNYQLIEKKLIATGKKMADQWQRKISQKLQRSTEIKAT